MIRKFIKLASASFFCAGLLMSVGCETRIGDFTLMSTKNIYAKNVNVRALPKTEGVEAEKTTFLGFGANIKDPLDMALEKGHGNMMIDAAVYVEDYIIFAGYKVRGTIVNVP